MSPAPGADFRKSEYATAAKYIKAPRLARRTYRHRQHSCNAAVDPKSRVHCRGVEGFVPRLHSAAEFGRDRLNSALLQMIDVANLSRNL